MWCIDRTEARRDLAIFERAEQLRGASPEEIAEAVGREVLTVADAFDHADELQAGHGEGLKVFDGVAHIAIKGMLLEAPDPILSLFGVEHSAYSVIKTQLAAALADDEVETIAFHVDSPGGMVAGMFEAGEEIAAAGKPTIAIVDGTSASAAYFLSSQADAVQATHRANRFGSVGVAVDVYVSEDVVGIASSDAPNKRPDVTTEEGRAVVRAELDQMHALFAEKIAAGRSVSVEKVNADFGQGGLLLADLALAAGMIDTINEEREATMSRGNTDNQVQGVRAALGLDKDTDREELIRACIQTKAKADERDAVQAKLDQEVALHEAAKDQLAKLAGQVEDLKARDDKREADAFSARRTAVIQKALTDNKILPAQVEHYTAIASNEAGLKGLEDLFAVTAPMGLTQVSPAVTEPKGKTKAPTVDEYVKTYRVKPEVAKRALARRAEKAENQ